MEYTMKGNLKKSPMSICVIDNSMTKILSLKEVENYFRVTMDTNEDHTMLVRLNKYRVYRFKQCGDGLYYLDIPDPEIVPLTTKDTITDY